ncbi:LamG domain-containing protein [Neorhodopirellula lusitana]|uniref:glycosyl hydrolase n=1 Tax=Neorhodopirellula lusitana TaxID=445327 RepID=UPI00384E6BFF
MPQIQTKIILALLLIVFDANVTVAAQPFFAFGEDPKPTEKRWVPVDEMSDEFAGDSLDDSKWNPHPSGDGWNWRGRPPALFVPENVTVKDGKMNVTVSKLDSPVERKGQSFTHQGAIVRSHQPGQVGWYYECRMKANQTVMSSTFWLNTKGGRKRLETDIQECVGRTTELTEPWAKRWDEIFHSNAIHWPGPDNPEKLQIQGQERTQTKNWERFYVYAAWWKSPDELRFYLDGKYVYSIHPKTKWDVPAYLTMAIETYDWNPLPDDGGLVESGTWDQRTTQYDWVRTWRLE